MNGLYAMTLSTDKALVRIAGCLSERQFATLRQAMALPVSLRGGKDGWTLAVSELGEFERACVGIPFEMTDAARALVEASRVPPPDRAVGRDRLAHFASLGTGLDLMPFQAEGVTVLAANREWLLADQMGLGKTPQLLVALPVGVPVLAVVPAIVVPNWGAEARRWRPDYRVTTVSKRTDWRMPEPGEILLSSPGMMPAEHTLPVPAGMHLLQDEAHQGKESKTARHKSFLALHKLTRLAGGTTWLATGTPLQNHPPELWNVLNMASLGPVAFGHWGRFSRLFGGSRTRWVPTRGKGGKGRKVVMWGGRPAPEVARCMSKVMLRRTREEVLPQLPTKRRVDVVLGELDSEAARACDEAMAALAAAGINVADENCDLLDKITDPSHVSELSRARAQLAAAKVASCVELIQEFEAAEEPVLVLSAYVAPCNALASRDGWACITGETPTKERGRIVEEFQAGRLKGLALTFRAGGVGVTLTRAANVVENDLDWNPAIINQGEDRCVRIGQTRGVLVQRLVADHPLDKHVVRLLAKKQRMIEEAGQ